MARDSETRVARLCVDRLRTISHAPKHYYNGVTGRSKLVLATAVVASGAALLSWSVARARKISRRLERRAREHSLALQRSNEEFEQFASVIAHDLQEPLRMVTSYTKLLAERYRGQLDQAADEYIHYAVDGCANMRKLLDDLVVYARSGRRRKPLELVDANAIVQRALDVLRPTIEQQHASVTVETLPHVWADANQLVDVFQHLVGNALKYRSTAPPQVHVSSRQGEEVWVFSVTDNGLGLDMEEAERIFEVFQRLHPRDSYPGTGVGLAICRRIVARHGGTIWVVSTPGQGTTFFFTLPIEPNMDEPPGDPARLERQ